MATTRLPLTPICAGNGSRPIRSVADLPDPAGHDRDRALDTIQGRAGLLRVALAVQSDDAEDFHSVLVGVRALAGDLEADIAVLAGEFGLRQLPAEHDEARP